MMVVQRGLLLIGLCGTVAQSASTSLVECFDREECINVLRSTVTDGGGATRKLQVVSEATASELASALVDSQYLTVSNAQLNCPPRAFGLAEFSDGTHAFEAEGLGTKTSVVLSSGDASVLQSVSNDLFGTSTDHAHPGDADAEAAAGSPTRDACILEFDFGLVAGFATSHLFFEYLFMSEEYNEFVDTFNDPFVFLVDGKNIATVPQTSGDPVTINTVNIEDNSNLFRNNEINPAPYATEYDGFTSLLSTSWLSIKAGETHHAKLVVADALDGVYDTSVVLQWGFAAVAIQN